MNIQTKYPTTADEFLSWNEGREGKREFVGGRIIEMMVGVSKNHLVIASRLQHQLMNQLSPDDYVIGAAEFGIKTPSGVRYPDVLVDTLSGSGTDLSASAPLIVAEVLSPSSYNTDFGEKVTDYAEVQSLQHYLVLSQDEPRIWLWARRDDGHWSGPEMIAGRTEAVRLGSMGITVDLGLLYRGFTELGGGR